MEATIEERISVITLFDTNPPAVRPLFHAFTNDYNQQPFISDKTNIVLVHSQKLVSQTQII